MANDGHRQISTLEDFCTRTSPTTLSSSPPQPMSPELISPQFTSSELLSPQRISSEPASPQVLKRKLSQPKSPRRLSYELVSPYPDGLTLQASALNTRGNADYASPLEGASTFPSQHDNAQEPPREGGLSGNEGRFPGAPQRTLTHGIPDPPSPDEGETASASNTSHHPPSLSHQGPEIRAEPAPAQERSDPRRPSVEDPDANLLPLAPASQPPVLESATADGRPGNCFDTAKLDAEGEKVMKELGMGQKAQAVKKKLSKFFEDEVKLERKEKYQVQAEYKRLQKDVITDLEDKGKAEEKKKPWKWEFYNCGSTYDGTKVTRADEIDCLLCPKLHSRFLEVVLEGAPLPFCFLKLKNSKDKKAVAMREELSDFISDGDFISSAKYKEWVFDVLRDTVQKNRRAHEDVAKFDQKSASFPVLYQAIPRSDGQGSDFVALDLVPAIHIDTWKDMFSANLQNERTEGFIDDIKKEGFDLVTKECEKVLDVYEDRKHLLWRLSFSRAEKYITKHADGTLSQGKTTSEAKKTPQTCRKVVMRLLKRFLELFKGFNNSRGQAPDPLGLKLAADHLRESTFPGMNLVNFKFSTFQIKTLMWTEFFVKSPGNNVWLMTEKPKRLHCALLEMKKMLCGERLVANFFLRDVDIMDGVPLEERRFYYVLFYVAEKIFSPEAN